MLNALEARATFKADINILVIKLLDNQNTNAQIASMVNTTNWEKVFYIKRSKLSINFLRDLWLLRKLKKQIKQFDRVFMGDFIPWNIRVFAQNLDCEELILLDDGLATIAVQNNYIKYPNTFHNTKNKPYQKAKVAKYLFGLGGQIEQPIHLFSSFQLKALPQQTIYENKFSVIKSKIAKCDSTVMDDTMYIIGSPYVEKHMLRKTSYLSLLRQIKEKHSQLKLIYISHRAESKENLQDIESLLACKVEQFDSILEIAFIKYQIHPVHVCGFTSTALVNLKKMYDKLNVHAYWIRLDEMPLDLKVRVEAGYDYMIKEGIKVEKLPSNSHREHVI